MIKFMDYLGRVLVRVLVGGIGLVSPDSGAAARPLVGAIRWDAWTGGTVTETMQGTLGPSKYHERLPWFAEVRGDGSVRIDGGVQAVMDAEIDWASASGLDYWAFLLYPEESVMSVALKRYLESPRQGAIRFCLILHGTLQVSATDWPREKARVIALLQSPGYLKVRDDRPLVYEFQARHNAEGQRRFDELREAIREAGMNPYYVFMGWNPNSDWQEQASKGFDAVSQYACASDQAMDFGGLVRLNEEGAWKPAAAAGVPFVPLVTTGWNKEPRKDHPVPWEVDPPYRHQTAFIPPATPEEIASHLRNGLAFVEANPQVCPTNVLLLYAWNEHDEGGWLAPTWQPNGSPNTGRLDAIRAVLRPGAGDIRPEPSTRNPGR